MNTQHWYLFANRNNFFIHLNSMFKGWLLNKNQNNSGIMILVKKINEVLVWGRNLIG